MLVVRRDVESRHLLAGRFVRHIVRLRTFDLLPDGGILGQYRIILSADTASEVRQMLTHKRR